MLSFSLLGAGFMLFVTMILPKESTLSVIVFAWIGTILSAIAFGAGYTFTKAGNNIKDNDQ